MIQVEKRKYTKVQVFIVDMKILEYNQNMYIFIINLYCLVYGV